MPCTFLPHALRVTVYLLTVCRVISYSYGIERWDTLLGCGGPEPQRVGPFFYYDDVAPVVPKLLMLVPSSCLERVQIQKSPSFKLQGLTLYSLTHYPSLALFTPHLFHV